MPDPNGQGDIETAVLSKGDKDKAAAGATRQLGSGGLSHFGGYLLVEDNVPALRSGDQRRRVFTEMWENDPVVGAVMFFFDQLMRSVEWNVTPADYEEIEKRLILRKLVSPEQAKETKLQAQQEADKKAAEEAAVLQRPAPKPKPVHPLAQKAADHISSCIEDMSHSLIDHLSQVLSFLPLGWSYFEICYKYREGPDGQYPSKYTDGLIGWRKFLPIPQDTLHKWDIADDGGINGLWQLAPGQTSAVPIPIEKALLFRTTTHNGNPEGRSVLRPAYRPWYFKKRIEEIEGIGIERDLAGLPIMYVPPRWLLPSGEQNPAEQKSYSDAAKILRNVKRDDNEGVMLPSYFDEDGNRELVLELLTSGGRRQFDTDSIVGRYDQRIAMVVLADFILLGHEKVGSKSLGDSKIDLARSALTAWLDLIASVYNKHAIPRLLRMNGIDPSAAPKLEHSKVEQIDLVAIAEYVSKIAGSGLPLWPDPILENYLRRIAGFPEREGGEEL